jgi:hypothetical protein
MITINKPVYICEFCKKKYFRKHACERHEKYCLKNPVNDFICFKDCKHLELIEMSTQIGWTGEDELMRDLNCYQCNAKDIYLYSSKAEFCNHSTIEFSEKMPLTCDKYKSKKY